MKKSPAKEFVSSHLLERHAFLGGKILRELRVLMRLARATQGRGSALAGPGQGARDI